MAKQSIVSIAAAAIQDDLCNWEFVNHSDESDDDESSYEVESIDLVESIDSLSSSSDVEDNHDHHEDHDVNDEEKEGPTNDVNVFDHHHDDEVVACSRVSDSGQNHVIRDELRNFVDNRDKIDGVFEYNNGSILNSSGHLHDDHDDEEDDDDHDDDDDGYDMDDELVPWEVKDKFVRQRIRKTGKISIGRNARSKKSALVFTRPGCVRGKHGLGLKVY